MTHNQNQIHPIVDLPVFEELSGDRAQSVQGGDLARDFGIAAGGGAIGNFLSDGLCGIGGLVQAENNLYSRAADNVRRSGQSTNNDRITYTFGGSANNASQRGSGKKP